MLLLFRSTLFFSFRGLDNGANHNPDDPTIDRDTLLKEKMITDSIILQAGAQEGYITLDPTVYNSSTKDYFKRIEAVRTVKKQVTFDAASIHGALVAIWFMNNNPGPAGYEKGREIAYATIKPLYDQVKNGAMTIQEAGKRVAETEELAQVDRAYKVNAFIEFRKLTGEKLVYDETFNQTIYGLNPGELTDLVVLKDYEGGRKEVYKEAAYMFAQLFGKKESAVVSFENWLQERRGRYDVSNL